MITNLKIRNFKSIKQADVKCLGVNIIIGANNSGKSNLLESLEYYSRSLIVPLDELFGPGPFSYSNIFHKGSDINKKGIEMSVEFHSKTNATHSFRIDSIYTPKKYPKFQLKVVNESINGNESHFERNNQEALLFREKE